MNFFTRKVYIKDESTQTESMCDTIFLCFTFYNFIEDYGGHTDYACVRVPVLKDIYDNLEDAKEWKEREQKNNNIYKCIIRQVNYTEYISQLPTIIETVYRDDTDNEENDDNV